MANSRYGYVRLAEQNDTLLPSTYLLVRIDGKSFHRFSTVHAFEKPNDRRALDLMNAAALKVVRGKETAGEVVLAFGESDEYSFLLKRDCKLYGRRSAKLVTLIVSMFTAAYVFLWPQYFPDSPLSIEDLPIFDGRVVQYSTEKEIKDYFRWRQVDTHINNLYNTCFWSLVLLSKPPLSEAQAHAELSGTVSAQKNELLFTRFSINYNALDALYRKGSIILWQDEPSAVESQPSKEPGNAPSSLPTPHPVGAPTSTLSASASSPVPSPETATASISGSSGKKLKKPRREAVIVHEDLIAEAWWGAEGRGRGLLD